MSTPPASGPIDVKIGIPTKIPSQDPNRANKFDLIFTVEYGPFSRTVVTLPEEAATPEAVEARVREEIGKLKTLGNKTIQV